MSSPALDAFAGYGIELEYAIVSDATLDCLPIADRLLARGAGEESNDVDRGLLGWSNEFVMHVLEIKNQQPQASLAELAGLFQGEVRAINAMLGEWQARLLPTAMHPWMDPARETRLWPHDPWGIYRSYGRIFDIRTHGWANLQSMHINLPFRGDAQFARLHAAARLVLPLIPALAASSPVADGRLTGFADYRMEVYRTNAQAFPEIAGLIVPDSIATEAEYEEAILAPMYRAIAPHDPEEALQEEWLNSRGAIARFDRSAIEIRVTDTQECPQADLAIAAAVADAVQALYREETATLAAQQAIATPRLASILQACMRDGENARIGDGDYLALLGYPGRECRAGALWRHLARRLLDGGDAGFCAGPLGTMLEHGTLSSRIVRALDGDCDRARLARVYRRLADCLQEGRMFLPDGAGA